MGLENWIDGAKKEKICSVCAGGSGTRIIRDVGMAAIARAERRVAAESEVLQGCADTKAGKPFFLDPLCR